MPTLRFSGRPTGLAALLALLLAGATAHAQSAADRAADGAISADLAAGVGNSFISQALVAETIERRTAASIRDVPRVHYDYYIVPNRDPRSGAPITNTVLARNLMYNHDFAAVGGKPSVMPLLWILNRRDPDTAVPGDTLIVPTRFDLDFRAYSPFPRYYPGAAPLGKVVILEKHIQAWAAYQDGELERWGIISTGVQSSRTPSGRFNVNWKQEYRVSTLSPGYGSRDPNAELWEMHWVMNLHEARGIHMHQYALPTSGPASHGCIRLLDPDAIWLYNWTDTWRVTGQRNPISSAGARITQQGTMVLIIGEDINEPPRPFEFRDGYPVIRMVSLPPDPFQVPAGSPQQTQFDRSRRSS